MASMEYHFTGSKNAAHFKINGRDFTLTPERAQRLEWDLFTWLNCYDLGHIHAEYSKDKVTYRVCRECNCMQYRTRGNTKFRPLAWILSSCKSFFRKTSTCEGLHSCSDDNCVCVASNKLHKCKKHKSKGQKAKK